MANNTNVFDISDQVILYRLHKAAVETIKGKTVVFNTAIGDIGVGKENGAFSNKKGIYEVAVYAELEKYQAENDKKLTSNKDELNKVKEENQKLVETQINELFKQLAQYFKWFAGEDASKQIEKQIGVQQFIPPSIKEKPKVNDFKIEEVKLDNNAVKAEYKVGKQTITVVVSDKAKPTIGLKAAYKLIYEFDK